MEGAFAAGPVLEEGVDERDEFVEAHGLFEVGVGAEGVGLIDVAVEAGAAGDDGWDFAAGRVLAQPAQDVEAGVAAHLEIEQKKVGHGIGVAIGKTGAALEVINDFEAVVDFDDMDLHALAIQCFVQQLQL